MKVKYSQLSQKRINLRKAIPLKKPFTLLIEPTNRCNLRCNFCFHNIPEFRKIPKGYMDFLKFADLIDSLADWKGGKLKVIRLIGFGEPLLHPHIAHMVTYIKMAEVAERVEITTNGTLLVPTICKELIESGLDYLRVSAYGNIRQRIKDFRTLRGDREYPFIYVKLLDKGDVSKYKDVADEVAIEPKHNWLNGTEGDSICAQPFKMMSVRWNGDVIVCDPDWACETYIGNAFEVSIEDIWKGKPMKCFQKMQLEHRRKENPSCRKCSFVDNEFYVRDRL